MAIYYVKAERDTTHKVHIALNQTEAKAICGMRLFGARLKDVLRDQYVCSECQHQYALAKIRSS